MTRREKLKARRRLAARWEHMIVLCRVIPIPTSTDKVRLGMGMGDDADAEEVFASILPRGYRPWRRGCEARRSHWAKRRAKARRLEQVFKAS